MNEHHQPFGAPGNTGGTEAGYNGGKNLYDRFYEGETPNSNPAGLFDYSKGAYSGIVTTVTPVVWDGSNLVTAPSSAYTGNQRTILVALSGFSSAGQGKLIGPSGNEQDTEEFLSFIRS